MLKENILFSKHSKCMFLLRAVAFHGHIISSERIKVDPRETKAVKNCPRPLTPTDTRSFLGLVGYYQRFFDGLRLLHHP